MIKTLTVVGWVVLIVTGLLAIDALLVGLTFGFALWDIANPLPTVMWLGILAAPILIAIGLGRRETPAILAAALVAGCLLDGAWMIVAFSG